jgi:hypothetical protein
MPNLNWTYATILMLALCLLAIAVPFLVATVASGG